jgi:translation initiation factor 1
MKARQTFRGVVLPAGTPRKRSQQAPVRQGDKVRVAREVSGRSGKGVSVISGLALGAAELDALGAALRRYCGAGGTVRNGVIEIQGEHRDRLVAELRRLGYAATRAGG